MRWYCYTWLNTAYTRSVCIICNTRHAENLLVSLWHTVCTSRTIPPRCSQTGGWLAARVEWYVNCISRSKLRGKRISVRRSSEVTHSCFATKLTLQYRSTLRDELYYTYVLMYVCMYVCVYVRLSEWMNVWPHPTECHFCSDWGFSLSSSITPRMCQDNILN
jgi:hypothetical protein